MNEKIVELLLNTHRPGMENLIEWMGENNYFNAPCSGGHHLAKEGGLAEHSLNVYELMKSMYEETLGNDCEIPEYSIIICALLHDLGKCGDYGKANYIPNMIKDGRPTKAEPEQKYKQSEDKPYKINPDLLYVDHEVRSISIASKFIQLTEDEMFAILYHNGLYGTFKYAIQGKETPLDLHLHMADIWASRVTESKDEQPE